MPLLACRGFFVFCWFWIVCETGPHQLYWWLYPLLQYPPGSAKPRHPDTHGETRALPRRLTKTGNSGCLRQQTTRISGCHSAAYLPHCEKSLYFFSVLLTGCGSLFGYCGGNLTCEVGRQITHPGHLAIQSQYRLYSHLTISYLLIW